MKTQCNEINKYFLETGVFDYVKFQKFMAIGTIEKWKDKWEKKSVTSITKKLPPLKQNSLFIIDMNYDRVYCRLSQLK